MNGNGSMLGFVLIVWAIKYWYVVGALVLGLGFLFGRIL